MHALENALLHCGMECLAPLGSFIDYFMDPFTGLFSIRVHDTGMRSFSMSQVGMMNLYLATWAGAVMSILYLNLNDAERSKNAWIKIANW